MPWEDTRLQSALKGGGRTILAALQAAWMCGLFSQGIGLRPQPPGLGSPGPLGRVVALDNSPGAFSARPLHAVGWASVTGLFQLASHLRTIL